MALLLRLLTNTGFNSGWGALGLGLLALGMATSCSPEVTTGGGTDPNGACMPGMQTCIGNAVNLCGANGSYAPTQTCDAAMTCDNTLGCVQCAPGVPTCVGNDVHDCSTAGSIGALTESCAFGQTCKGGACIDTCELAASDFVYLVDTKKNFLSFAPKNDKGAGTLATDVFTAIGTLSCPTTKPAYPAFNGSVVPNSMAVDRHANAWVQYTNGEMFKVSPQNASCAATTYAISQLGWQVFGMGYVSDAPGAKTDTLYVARSSVGGNTDLSLGKIDSTLTLSKIGAFTGIISSPEMSGTGAAELYGYFPSNQAGSHIIALIDRTNAAFLKTYQLAPLPAKDQNYDYAFAQWGGRFYYFVTLNLANGSRVSRVYRYDPSTNLSTLVVDNSPYDIVGAGVSTCAPAVPIG